MKIRQDKRQYIYTCISNRPWQNICVYCSGTCLIRYTKRPRKCVRLSRMSELHNLHCILLLVNSMF